MDGNITSWDATTVVGTDGGGIMPPAALPLLLGLLGLSSAGCSAATTGAMPVATLLHLVVAVGVGLHQDDGGSVQRWAALTSLLCVTQFVWRARTSSFFARKTAYIVTTKATAQELSRLAVHKADQHLTYWFSGCYANSILMSTPASGWQRQKQIVHSYIVSRTAHFRELAAKTAAQITSDATGEDAGVTTRTVSLRSYIGEHVTAISGAALGEPGLPLANDAMGTSNFVVHGMHVALVLDALGILFLFRLLVQPFAPLFRARLRHDQLLRQWLHKSGAKFASRLLSECEGGSEEALGHLWVMTLGSTVPETVITCRILYELAMATPAEQDTVAGLFEQETLERTAGAYEGEINAGAADAWIDSQLSRHHFFPQSSKYLEADIVLSDGTRLRQGDHIGFNYGAMSLSTAGTGYSLPFGFGRRGCPGATIGRGVVKTLVGAVVCTFRLSRPAELVPSFWESGLHWWDNLTGAWFRRHFAVHPLLSWLVDAKVLLTLRRSPLVPPRASDETRLG